MIFCPKLFIIFFFFALSNQIFAQSDNAINELKNGVLIVVIPGNHKKIEVLKKELKSPKVKDKRKKRIKKIIDITEQQREVLVTQLYESFKENYHFSEFAFIYDTATVHILKKNVKKGIFIKDNDKIDLGDKSLFFLRYGNTNRTNTSGIEAWIITDNEFNDLEKPFPYYVAANKNFKKVIMAFFFQPALLLTTNEENKKIGTTLNKKLTKYYNSNHL